MSGKKAQYMDPVAIGDVMRAATVGVIVESKHPEWQVGTHVMGFGGLCDYYVGIPGVTMFYPCLCNSDDIAFSDCRSVVCFHCDWTHAVACRQ